MAAPRRRYKPSEVAETAIEALAPRCLEVWKIPRRLVEDLGWFADEPKARYVLVATVAGPPHDPTHVFLVEGTTQPGAYRFAPPARLTHRIGPRRKAHYVFADERFRRVTIRRAQRWLTHDSEHDLPARRWPDLRSAVGGAPANWRPVVEAWEAGGCPDPRERS